MERSMKLDKITLGTCYYPEHWPEEMWEEDLQRMLENGIEVIRIAEFAWSKIEPREGEFTYGFFDRFLEKAEKAGMKVIFCTPSATPPAWLTNKYPEVLNANMDGVLYRHGCRRHYNYNSPKYQELVTRIVEKSAAHYAPHPAIIGWQIDNELNCEKNEFYSESDTIAFRVFLKKKYHTMRSMKRGEPFSGTRPIRIGKRSMFPARHQVMQPILMKSWIMSDLCPTAPAFLQKCRVIS